MDKLKTKDFVKQLKYDSGLKNKSYKNVSEEMIYEILRDFLKLLVKNAMEKKTIILTGFATFKVKESKNKIIYNSFEKRNITYEKFFYPQLLISRRFRKAFKEKYNKPYQKGSDV